MTDGAGGGPKRPLRRRIIELRDALDAQIRADYSQMIADTVTSLPEWDRAGCVHLFASFGSEVDTRPIIERALGAGKRPVLPVVTGLDRELEHALIEGLSDLEPGFRGIPEPCRRCPRVAPGQVDLVIVPGVAFDEKGGRLGYGGGFYDRFLASCPAPRIAIAFSVQVVGAVPTDDHDLPVDAVVTEAGIIRSIRGTPPGR